MKTKDWITIAVIVVFSTVLSFVICNALIGGKKIGHQKVEVVSPITDEFNLPDQKYFNKDSVNPTQLIQIGNDTNQTPFNGN